MNENEILVFLATYWVIIVSSCICSTILFLTFIYKFAKKIKEIVSSCEVLAKEANHEMTKAEEKSHAVRKNQEFFLKGFSRNTNDTNVTLDTEMKESIEEEELKNSKLVVKLVDFEKEKTISKYKSINELEDFEEPFLEKIGENKNLNKFEKGVDAIKKKLKLVKTSDEDKNKKKNKASLPSKNLFNIDNETFKLSEIKSNLEEV